MGWDPCGIAQAGQETRMWFKLLMNILLSTGGITMLKQLNPFLSDPHARTVLSLTGACLLAGR